MAIGNTNSGSKSSANNNLHIITTNEFDVNINEDLPAFQFTQPIIAKNGDRFAIRIEASSGSAGWGRGTVAAPESNIKATNVNTNSNRASTYNNYSFETSYNLKYMRFTDNEGKIIYGLQSTGGSYDSVNYTFPNQSLVVIFNMFTNCVNYTGQNSLSYYKYDLDINFYYYDLSDNKYKVKNYTDVYSASLSYSINGGEFTINQNRYLNGYLSVTTPQNIVLLGIGVNKCRLMPTNNNYIEPEGIDHTDVFPYKTEPYTITSN